MGGYTDVIPNLDGVEHGEVYFKGHIYKGCCKVLWFGTCVGSLEDKLNIYIPSILPSS